MSISKLLSRYRTLFLLVRIRSGVFRLTLPLALFLLDETFEIIDDWLWLAEKFIPRRFYREYFYTGLDSNCKRSQNAECNFWPRQVLGLCHELMNELRRHGRYSLLEAEVGKDPYGQRISIEIF
jgi:hypothetical protein